MEQPFYSNTEFYKAVLDCTDKINEAIRDFGFKLSYNINSENKNSIYFTITHGTGFDKTSYTFVFSNNSSEVWNDNYISSTVIQYIQEVIHLTINEKFIESNKPIEPLVEEDMEG